MKKKKDNIVHIRAVVPLEESPNSNQSSERDSWTKRYKKIWIISILIILLILGLWFIRTQVHTYTEIEVIKTYSDVSTSNNNFVAFGSGFLRYGKDGVAYINQDGETLWNYPYQITNPVIEMTDRSAVIADVGGNQIVVIDESGVKGEIETYLPIEMVTVSEQGIVAALVKDGSTPQVICYDAVGNVLVEHKASLTGTGYPVSVSLSLDGTMLLVTYLQATESGISSSYAYYDFSGDDLISISVVQSGVMEDSVISETQFISEDTSVMIHDGGIEIFSGENNPELAYSITINKKIQNVFYGEETIGVLLESSSGGVAELRVYDDQGEMLLSKEITGEYENVDILENQIVLYGVDGCLIYTMQGVEKFNGDIKKELSGIFPINGINKYVIIGDEGMEKVRLVR